MRLDSARCPSLVHDSSGGQPAPASRGKLRRRIRLELLTRRRHFCQLVFCPRLGPFLLLLFVLPGLRSCLVGPRLLRPLRPLLAPSASSDSLEQALSLSLPPCTCLPAPVSPDSFMSFSQQVRHSRNLGLAPPSVHRELVTSHSDNSDGHRRLIFFLAR